MSVAAECTATGTGLTTPAIHTMLMRRVVFISAVSVFVRAYVLAC